VGENRRFGWKTEMVIFYLYLLMNLLSMFSHSGFYAVCLFWNKVTGSLALIKIEFEDEAACVHSDSKSSLILIE